MKVRKKSLEKVMEWLKKGGCKRPLIDIFKTGHHEKYGVFHERIFYCYDLYIEEGKVPAFVSELIVRHFLIKGGNNEAPVIHRDVHAEKRNLHLRLV